MLPFTPEIRILLDSCALLQSATVSVECVSGDTHAAHGPGCTVSRNWNRRVSSATGQIIRAPAIRFDVVSLRRRRRVAHWSQNPSFCGPRRILVRQVSR
ncbi:hypothetical protein ANTPLA_LOCUS5830 [Anthophora plagiata]